MTDSGVDGLLGVDLGPGVRAGFTRVGNLSRTVGDQAGVLDRRRALALWAGAPVAYAWQVHGRRVHVVAGPGEVPEDGPVAQADALVTVGGRAALAVLVADCVPVLIADGTAGVVAAVHAGRAGVAADVLGAAVGAMVDAGADPARLRAVVGPAICGRCYEVPAAMRDEVSAAVAQAASTTSWGTPALDLPAAAEAQLRAVGVPVVADVGQCTLEDPRWFSHRGATADAGRPPGRFAGVVRALAG